MKKIKLFVTLLFVIVSVQAQMAQPDIYTNENGIAIDGFDVVSYLEDEKAMKGSETITTMYKDAEFRFASKENMEMFKKSPDKYLPAYGGYCAFAIGKMNKKVPVNPETFKIVKGRTHLFFNGENPEGKMVNTKPMWDGNEKELKKMAEKNWMSLSESDN